MPDRVNILMVDDQPQKLLSYEAMLEGLGERLLRAQSGNEAFEVLLREEIAVILLDVNMPGMDGFETAAMIREHPRFTKTPIIFVTAVNTTDLDRIRGYELSGSNVKMLLPVPWHREYDDVLHRRDHGAEYAFAGLNRELQGLRKDGSI